MAQKKSKLGRNPFDKEGRSRVGRMIEASFDAPEAPAPKLDRGLLERFQDMRVSLNLRELIKGIKGSTL